MKPSHGTGQHNLEIYDGNQDNVMVRLITFEGVEGCGKTTQIRLAGEFLEQRHIPVTMTAEPGGTPIGRRIREMLLHKSPDEDICSETEILLFAAARAEHVRKVILPSLMAGKVVLCDRFFDATLAYQGFGRGLDIPFIKEMNEYASPSLKPGMTVLFDLPVEAGLARAMNRIALLKKTQSGDPEDRFEQEALEFHKKVREGYLSLAKAEPGRFKIVNAQDDIPVIHEQVCGLISNFLEIEQ